MEEETSAFKLKKNYPGQVTAKNMYDIYRDLEELCGGFTSNTVRLVGKPGFFKEPKVFHHIQALERHYKKDKTDYFLCSQNDIEKIIAANDRQRRFEESLDMEPRPTMTAQLIDRRDKNGSYIEFSSEEGLAGCLHYLRIKRPHYFRLRDMMKIVLGNMLFWTGLGTPVGDEIGYLMKGMTLGLGFYFMFDGMKGASGIDHWVSCSVFATKPEGLEKVKKLSGNIETIAPD